MTRRARDHNRAASTPAGCSPASRRPLPDPPRRSFLKTWAFRLGAACFVPLLCLLLLELALRLSGYGFPTAFFRTARIEGRLCRVENPEFGLRFFPPSLARLPTPIVMPEKKEKGAIRIFVFGESAALGDPRPNFGAARYLEVLLKDRFPNTRFELVNTSMTAINSHAILPIARECAKLEGDIWIVYMGNNEMVGPFGAATVFGGQAPPLPVVRLNLALQELRLGQLLVHLGQISRGQASQPGWQGMEMFLKNQVPPQDPRRETVYASYRRNLEELLDAGVGAGAKILLSTVAVNYRDCAPFATVPATNFPDATPAGAHPGSSAPASNPEKLQEIVQANPWSAEAHFNLAQLLWRSNQAASAREHFRLAVDRDALPFRADSRINGAAVQLATQFAGKGVRLCDAEAALSEENPAGPGSESFFEHVHLTPDGNYRLARAWAEQLEKMLPASVAPAAGRSWASQGDCERRLALTDWNRVSILQEVINRCGQPPLRAQAGNAERVNALERSLAAHRANLSTARIEEARQVYLQAIQSYPDDFRLRENFAEFLDAIKDAAAAAEQRQEVCRRTPHFYFSHYALGLTLKDAGRPDEALASLKRAADLHPRQGEVRLDLGRIRASRERWNEALADFEQAARLLPKDPRPPLFRGETLWKLRQPEAALASVREAIARAPGYWEAHYRLGDYLAAREDLPGAAAAYSQAATLNPGYARAHANLGVALARLGRHADAVRAFDRALASDPQNQKLLEFRARAAAEAAGLGRLQQ